MEVPRLLPLHIQSITKSSVFNINKISLPHNFVTITRGNIWEVLLTWPE